MLKEPAQPRRPVPMNGAMPLPPPQPGRFVSPADGTEQTYLLDMPEGMAAGLLVYLHGATNHQQQGMTEGIYHDSFGFIRRWAAGRGWAYLCPEYRGDSWMNAAAEVDLDCLIEDVCRRAGTRKVLLMGGSMGGTAALIYACRHPRQLAGVLALCPATDMADRHKLAMLRAGIETAYGGDPQSKPAVYQERSSIRHAAGLASLPVFIAHGEADQTIPVRHSRDMAAELERLGGPVRYVEIPGGDHDAPARPTYIAQGLEWLTGG